MKARAGGLLFSIALVTASSAIAQQPAPPPPTQSAPASLGVPNPLAGNPPVALTVPNPLSGLQPGPRDLYQSPDGSDRFQQGASFPAHPAHPIVIVPGPYYVGAPYFLPYSTYDPYKQYGHPYGYRYAGYGYGHPGYGYGHPGYGYPHARFPRFALPRGGLVLETLPDDAQVLVDGYYIGLAQDYGLRGRPLDLVIGPHRLELRAPGYEPLYFSVMIEPDVIVRYRGDMQSLAQPPLTQRIVVQSASAQKGVYVIPNCYAGNKPPSGNLPAGCDTKKVESRK